MNPHIIDLPKIIDPRGNLTFMENPRNIPFVIERVFWTYDVPGGEKRGGHAYKLQQEIIIALSGSFDVIITHIDGEEQKFQLNRSYYGLYLPPLTWRRMENFSTLWGYTCQVFNLMNWIISGISINLKRLLKMKNSTVYDCTLIQLSKNHQVSGNITSVNGGREVPFNINRIYYLFTHRPPENNNYLFACC